MNWAKAEGREIVGVLGLGFVGTAVAANLARARNPAGITQFYVVGVDLDHPEGREKVARLNKGIPPTYSNDSSLEAMVRNCVLKEQNLAGTTDFSALNKANVVVVCINLDVDRRKDQVKKVSVPVEPYEEAVFQLGKTISPNTLIMIESTLPLGMCDMIIYPALCRGQKAQGLDPVKNPPLLAFCYERVMPGPDYLNSVNNYWRTYAGINPESSRRAREFLEKYVNTKKYPLWGHKSTRAAEMAKLMENSYRAMNIAFIEEWADLAESAGVDLFDVVASIRLRKGTHDNMMWPGLGVGGYCLTKDAMLAAFGAESLLKAPAPMPFSRRAILTNERMPLKAYRWVESHFGGSIQGKKALLIGVTYRPGVADTRNTATEILARKLVGAGASVTAWDPLVDTWDEMPEIKFHRTIEEGLRDQDLVVICLPDRENYQKFLPELLPKAVKNRGIVVDPWNMLGDALVSALQGRGVTVRIYGRGDLMRGSAR
jgi:nucleotide sugar dehydrogenase